MGLRSMILGDRPPTVTAAAGDPPADPSPVEVRIAAERDARADAVAPWTTREVAMCDSVVNRARDLICGTLATWPLTRTTTYGQPDGAEPSDIGPGWLAKPDPDHSRGYVVAGTTDDLFFRAFAYWWITARGPDGYPIAAKWLPMAQLVPWVDGGGVDFYDDGTDALPGLAPVTQPRMVSIDRRDLIVFESPLDGVLAHGGPVLSTSAKLQTSANRFAAAEFAAGWLHQVDGEPLDAGEAQQLVDDWASNRRRTAVGYTSREVEYHETQMQPDTLQLVEGRTYQDAAVARLVNLPAYSVGVAVPGDSMTYKTAATARLDVVDFGLAPFVAAWQQALSDETVTPRGTTVAFDPSAWLRTAQLSALREQAQTGQDRTDANAPA